MQRAKGRLRRESRVIAIAAVDAAAARAGGDRRTVEQNDHGREMHLHSAVHVVYEWFT